MSKQKKEKKGFWGEFKEFITRGNVLDMAVGVIVGGAFTAIVTALSNNILKPIINWILALMLGTDSLSNVYTFLKRVPDAADPSLPDLTQSIYIDWGAFINAIINFLLIALVLFCIVKAINKLNAMKQELKEAAEKREQEREEAEKAKLAAETAAQTAAKTPAPNEAAAPAEKSAGDGSAENAADEKKQS
ncbi:MAG: large conductance mechanosensitive channel protein MscL [Clostridia bacterium]|nr:large conductance mechanosensitive channel protein MscL [Clostridia bacterium]